MYNFFRRSQNFGQKPPESSKGSILTWNMAFKSDLGPFLVLREANFDRGVQKVDFSIFKFFFTFFFVKHHHVGHFANPIWQIKGIFSADSGDWIWKGSLPSNSWQFALNRDQFLFLPADFAIIFPKYLYFFFDFFSIHITGVTHFTIYFFFVHGYWRLGVKMAIFLPKNHFRGLNSIVFEIRQPYLSINGQNWSIIVWPNCSHWKVDDFRFLKLPKMLSWLRDMPILSK